MKIGIVDVGGGYRGVFTCGIYDAFMESGLNLDLGIGVSAGCANLSAYLSGQPGRNYRVTMEYGHRKEYASLENFFKKGSFLDLDYIFSTIPNSTGLNPLDYPAFARNPMEFVVVATDAQTGDAVYFDKRDIAQDAYDVMKASCAIPFVCKPYQVDGKLYYDGAVGDCIPIEKAFEMGCDKVILVLTKPADEQRNATRDWMLAQMIRWKHPRAAKKLVGRAKRYNETMELARAYQKEGKLMILAPEDTCGVDTLTKDRVKLEALYQKGREAGERAIAQIREWME